VVSVGEGDTSKLLLACSANLYSRHSRTSDVMVWLGNSPSKLLIKDKSLARLTTKIYGRQKTDKV
jgi:hypothetical protein